MGSTSTEGLSEPKEPRYCDLEEALPGYVSINEAARYLKIHFATVVRLIGRGLLPANYFKERWLIERNTLQAFGGIYNHRTGMYGPLSLFEFSLGRKEMEGMKPTRVWPSS